MKRRIGRGKKRCARTGKIRYRDENSARHVIGRASSTDSPVIPVRCYPCQFCGGWHLTSQAR